MRITAKPILILFLLIIVAGCAARQTVMVPPRIDLTQHEMIGVIDFKTTQKGELGPLVTRRFTEAARQDQGLVRIVGFGSEKEVLRSIDGERLSQEVLQALGRERGVRTILIGELVVSDIRPDLRLTSGLRSGSLSAKVDATLAVELIETATGASIWSSSARATRSVGHISVFKGGEFAFDAEDPEQAYGGLVDSLVAAVTRDFRATWQQL